MLNTLLIRMVTACLKSASTVSVRAVILTLIWCWKLLVTFAGATTQAHWKQAYFNPS